MTDFASLLQPDRGGPAHSIPLVDKNSFEAWAKQQSPSRRALIEAARFDGSKGFHFLILPGGRDDEWEVVSAVAKVADLSPWCLAKLAETLPQGRYRLAEGDPGQASLGWLLGQHRLNEYKSAAEADRGARLVQRM